MMPQTEKVEYVADETQVWLTALRAGGWLIAVLVIGFFSTCAHTKSVIAGAENPLDVACAFAVAGSYDEPLCFIQ